MLHQFELLSDKIKSSISLTLEAIILGLGAYLFSFLCAAKAKARNAPQNKEAAHNKSKTIPLKLLLLSALRYLGRGWTFDDLEEATAINNETMRQFFTNFWNLGLQLCIINMFSIQSLLWIWKIANLSF